MGTILLVPAAILGIEMLELAGWPIPNPILLLGAVSVLAGILGGPNVGVASVIISLFYCLHALGEPGLPPRLSLTDKIHLLELIAAAIAAVLVINILRQRTQSRQREQAARAAAEAARLSEERFRTALRAAPIFVFGQDRDLRYTWYHSACETRQSRLELGKRDDQVYENPDDAQRLTAIKQRVLDTGKGTRQEITLQIGGRARCYDLTVEPLRDSGGQIAGITCAAVDLTDHKKVGRALRKTHRALAGVLESISDNFYALDRQWRFTYINAGAERYLDVPRESLLGKGIWESRPRMVGTVVEQNYRKAVADAETIVFEVGPPVSKCWLEVHAYPSDEGLSVYFRDITKRRQAEQALRESEAMLARAQQIAKLGSWEFHLESRRVLCSDQAYRILGLTPIQVQGSYETVFATVHPDDQPRLVRQMRRAFADGIPSHVEIRILRPDGTHRVALAQAERICDGDGKPMRLAGTVLDITDRKQSEQQLQVLNETLEQRVAERTAQLRTLASELTLAEQRERRRLAQILHDHLQQLLVGAKFSAVALRNRLSDPELLGSLATINDLLDQSVRVSRSLTVEISPPILYDGGLAAALQWLASWMQEKYGLAVDVQADERADPQGEDIRVLLFQAVRELLFNIVKHAGVCRASLRMEQRNGNQICIAVVDEGAGFDPAAQPSNGSHASGFGLLSIRERLEILGGKLEIDSAPGRGTQATLLAPLLTATKGSIHPAAVLVPGANAYSEPLASSEGATDRIRVLLADDHKILREGLIRLLQLYPDLEVVGEAADGAMAVALARQAHPDVILMDITMPQMNGVEATRLITAEMPNVRVIGLSMHTENDMAERMREAGAVGYLSKSSDPETVIAAIRGHCSVSESPETQPAATPN
jgi:PAS domain S-box-containing protein